MNETSHNLYRVLIVTGEVSDCKLLTQLLQSPQRSVESRDSLRDALEYLRHNPVDVIFADTRLPSKDVAPFLESVKEICPHARLMLAAGLPVAETSADVRMFDREPREDRISELGELLQLTGSYQP